MSDMSPQNAAQHVQQNNRTAFATNGNSSTKASLTENFDTELYNGSSGIDKSQYLASIPANDADEEMEDAEPAGRSLIGQYTASKDQLNEFASGETEEQDILLSRDHGASIAARETDYQRRRFDRKLSPDRADAFADTPADDETAGASYAEIMQLKELMEEEERVMKLIAEAEQKKLETNGDTEEHKATLTNGDATDMVPNTTESSTVRKRKKRWDVTAEDIKAPVVIKQEDELATATTRSSRWDEPAAADPVAEPAKKRRSRWDLAPEAPGLDVATSGGQNGAAAPAPGPSYFFSRADGSSNNWQTDEELDQLFPGSGYKIIEPPEGYKPIRRAPNVQSKEVPLATTNGYGGFMMQESVDARSMVKDLPTEIPGVGELQHFRPADMQYFGKLTDNAREDLLSYEEQKERKIMKLLLKVKNGTPPQRKTALRTITDNAKAFGPKALFDQILPLLMEKTLEDQERHLLVKVVDRILYKLDESVRPYTHKILVVIEPLLIDTDYYARVEGREIISNLAKAVGLSHMVSTVRPDLDSPDEYVRNTTARALAIVASALGIVPMLPFLRAVCHSKKSWHARHTGVKVVQQIPILMGCAILPHLTGLVGVVGPAINDENVKVRTVASLAIAALAEAATPYGIESFDPILNPLWTGARRQRGKGLAGFLKAVGYIIPLMDEEYANYYTGEIMGILIREFESADDEMRRVVLKVVSQCAGTKGVTPKYIKDDVLPTFFRSFWVRRVAMDKRQYNQVVSTTFDLGERVGCPEILENIVKHLKDDNESFRRMTIETIEKCVSSQGTTGIESDLRGLLIDGILYAFSEQSVEDIQMLNGFGTVVNALGTDAKDYFMRITSTILFRLDNHSPAIRQQAADLISRIAQVMHQCDESQHMMVLGVKLNEHLGEEYPEVLGSVLGALRALVTVLGISSMKPPVSELLPKLTPILRNRHEKVQENTIDLVGRIADRGPEVVNPKEWMRICFELLDMLKAHKKGIRRAANNTFGYIAKAVGPQDVLATLLNNLRVQERQSRVCTAVAIGIVAETCAPFTVLPALMVEYRVPELNVQNGVLKALSFMFEYIVEMAKDYVYAITPLLEDALIDRDQVHRQTAASVVKHIALGVVGLGCEDAMLHLLNLLFPNIFETSPHVIDRIIEAIDAIRMTLGTGTLMNYVWAGLFHPARKVRTPYWRLYNNAYVQNADAMVPYYPESEELGPARDELFIVI